jgi:hypothetical protein
VEQVASEASSLHVRASPLFGATGFASLWALGTLGGLLGATLGSSGGTALIAVCAGALYVVDISSSLNIHDGTLTVRNVARRHRVPLEQIDRLSAATRFGVRGSMSALVVEHNGRSLALLPTIGLGGPRLSILRRAATNAIGLRESGRR